MRLDCSVGKVERCVTLEIWCLCVLWRSFPVNAVHAFALISCKNIFAFE